MENTESTGYSWEHAKLDDIDCDTDRILGILESEKMGNSGFDSGMLAGMLGNRGIDPGIVALLNDRCKDGSWGNDGGLLVLLFLIILMGGRNGFGFGNGDGVAGVDRTVVNEANYGRILDAIGTQGTRQEVAIQGLSQSLNCDTKAIQNALCGVDKQLAVNQGSIVNAIQSCCCNLQGKLDQCCCQTNLNVERTGNSILGAIKDQNFQVSNQFAAQTALIQSQFCQQNAYLADQFCQIKMREDQREIQSLRDQLQQERTSAQTALILNAIANKDTINYTGTISGTTVSGAGTLS